MTIRHILFDADGVLQYPTQEWQPALQQVLGLADAAQAEALTLDIFAAEAEVLALPDGVVERLEAVHARWQQPGRVAEVLAVLHGIEVHRELIAIVQRLRAAGFGCQIASNQATVRPGARCAAPRSTAVLH